jgi:allantoate deiminase
MAELDVDALGRRAEAMIRALAAISADEGRITRLYLSPEHRRAADLVAGWMRDAGLDVDEDALGTVRGRLGSAGEQAGANGARRLLIGSHIDTVLDAGAYDGTLGVIAGILAVDHVIRTSGALPFGIDVLAFGDEEGSRFPATLLCSGAAAGRFDRAALGVVSTDGVRLDDALRAYGKAPEEAGAPRYADGEAAAYVEVHIEQGPVLEESGVPLGVVTAIAAQSRFAVTIDGEAGHAGTVPMGLRHDALAGAAALVLAVEAAAREASAEAVVATVGRIVVEPGASNVIPARASVSLDIRAPSDGARDHAVARIRSEAAAIAGRRGLSLSMTPVHEAAAVPCDPSLQGGLSSAVAAVQGTSPRLASGAGHDGQAMAALCPIGMLFVRCRGGISHNPAEHASMHDMGIAVAALVRFIEGFGAGGIL